MQQFVLVEIVLTLYDLMIISNGKKENAEETAKQYVIDAIEAIKAAREEEIRAHGRPVSSRTVLHKSRKAYDRRRNKKIEFE